MVLLKSSEQLPGLKLQYTVSIIFRIIIEHIIIIVHSVLIVSFINMKWTSQSNIIWFVFKISFSRKYLESQFLYH